MKKTKQNSILLGITTASAVITVLMVLASYFYSRQMGALQQQVNFIQRSKPLIAGLTGELIEYSKTHPSIDPILISTGIKPGAKTAPAPGNN